MIIKYDFLDNTTSEVEVDDNLGKIIGEMDKDEFNLNRKETRRHDYISQLEEQGYYIADDCNLLDDVIKSERYKELMETIEKLQPQQKTLLIRVYWKKEHQKDIAVEEGVSEMTISRRIKKFTNF